MMSECCINNIIDVKFLISPEAIKSYEEQLRYQHLLDSGHCVNS